MLLLYGHALLLHMVSYRDMRLLPGVRLHPALLATYPAGQFHSLQRRGGCFQHTDRYLNTPLICFVLELICHIFLHKARKWRWTFPLDLNTPSSTDCVFIFFLNSQYHHRKIVPQTSSLILHRHFKPKRSCAKPDSFCIHSYLTEPAQVLVKKKQVQTFSLKNTSVPHIPLQQ